jgi:hypothetical protein
LEKRFSPLFEYNADAKGFAAAAAAVCHPNFKLCWLEADHRQWAKGAFLDEAKRCSSNHSKASNESVKQNTTTGDFFDFEQSVGDDDQQPDFNAKVTILSAFVV